MTTYGTIPTSSFPAGTPINLEYISRAKERLQTGLGTCRPWREMFQYDLHCFQIPKSFSDAAARIRTNDAYFRMNYEIVRLLIIFLSLLWHPISLLVFVATMAAWLFLYFLRDVPLVAFGRTIADSVVLTALAVVTVAVLLFTGATGDIVTALLTGVAVVLIHGAVRKTDDLFFDEEAAGGLSRSSGVVSSSS